MRAHSQFSCHIADMGHVFCQGALVMACAVSWCRGNCHVHEQHHPLPFTDIVPSVYSLLQVARSTGGAEIPIQMSALVGI